MSDARAETKDIDFRLDSKIPAHRRVTTGVYVATLLFHAILLVMLLRGQLHVVRVASGGSPRTGIAAYVVGAVATSGTTEHPATHVDHPRKVSTATPARLASKSTSEPADESGASGGNQQGGTPSGPVSLGTGEGLTLLNKVTPVYPRTLEAARIAGVVVLEAIVHRDGTIGDVRVVRSSNAAFAQAAADAVKQWRYTPIPYEGLVTVTVNFTLQR